MHLDCSQQGPCQLQRTVLATKAFHRQWLLWHSCNALQRPRRPFVQALLQRGKTYWLPGDEAHPLVMDGVMEYVLGDDTR